LEKENALVLFARDPVPGKVKTRLGPLLDAETICNLYTRFLDDSLDKLRRVNEADGFVGVYPALETGYFNHPGDLASVSVFVQQGEDLGERMRNAFVEGFARGYRRVVIVGSDSPSLPVEYIRMAFRSEKDVVLGPATDGGYYLIGMKGRMVEVFDGIEWGGDRVLSDTLVRIKAAGVGIEALPVWYDVDRPEDLKFLHSHLNLLRLAGGTPEGEATRDLLDRINFQGTLYIL